MEKLTRREAFHKSGRMVMGAAVCLALPRGWIGCADESDAIAAGRRLRSKIRPVAIERLKITIVYDNNPYKAGLKTDWGFACLVEGLERTILFDTGRFDSLLMANLADLGIDPGEIDGIFLSHEHPDHIGGLNTVLENTRAREVYLAQSFSSYTKNGVQDRGAKVVAVGDPVRVTPGSLSSGEMMDFVKNEHALVIDTTGGLVVITGCAHPGIVDIVARSRTLVQKEVLLVLGGFHLMAESERGLQKIAAQLRAKNVRHVAPTHCSGPLCRNVFREIYGEDYLDCGVGRIITAGDLSGATAAVKHAVPTPGGPAPVTT